MRRLIELYLNLVGALGARGRREDKRKEQVIAFFRSLDDELHVQLEKGQYPPYHSVKSAAKENGIDVDRVRELFQGFLNWRLLNLQWINRKDQSP